MAGFRLRLTGKSILPMQHSETQHSGLSIVIPAYNEEGNIEACVRESLAVLQPLGGAIDVVAVDDGSLDQTPQILDRLAKELPQLTVVHNNPNIGCHPSSLVGFKAAKGDYILFIPGDRQIPAEEFPKFLAKAKEGCDVVYSWRVNRADPLHRLWISGLYNIMMRVFFGVSVHDVDSSSMLTKKAVETLLPSIRSDSAFISVEILIAAAKHGLKIGEVEIAHRPRTSGVPKGVNPKDLCYVPLDFLSMLIWFWRQKFGT